MIEILQSKLTTEVTEKETNYWACWLQLTQGDESWMLPITAPGELEKIELQTYFEMQEFRLWQMAYESQYPHDFYECIPTEQSLKAVALVTLSEINILRQRAGLPERTTEQLINAVKEKLKQLT